MILYSPRKINLPPKLIDVPSAWKGLESILLDLIERFRIPRNTALEFGVDYGYSTVALSNYFSRVIAVDHFKGDVCAGFRDNDFENRVRHTLSPYSNIEVIASNFEDFIQNNTEQYDLVHIDIVHEYTPTYQCGLWAAKHANAVIFHDTESFPEVKRAVGDIAAQENMLFYNYPHCCGLGILSKTALF
jgi:predicted O-methyltransferase YrrM